MSIQYSFIALITILLCGVCSAEDYCFDCHSTQEGTSNTFKKDAHYAATFSCSDCHGGDPKINDMNLSKTAEKGFRLRVKRQEIPDFCGGCHSNAKFMATYPSKLPTNQLAIYQRSVHGRKLAAGKSAAAECVDCHGIHDIAKSTDDASPVSAKNISATCGKCHPGSLDALKAGPHGQVPKINCLTCHGSHNTQEARVSMLTGEASTCTQCHKANSGQAKTAAQIADLLTQLAKDESAEGKAALARARAVVHTFNVATIKHGAEANPAATEPSTATNPSTPKGP